VLVKSNRLHVASCYSFAGRGRRPAAHRALGRNNDGLVSAYRPHPPPALSRAKARLALRARCR